MSVDARVRAALLLGVSLVVGVAIGAAGEREYLNSHRPSERRRTSVGTEAANADRLPVPLEQLGLTSAEAERLHAISRRWRAKTGVALSDFRQRVGDIENSMFAEMLCALPDEKRDRYVAQLRTQQYPDSIISKRLQLVQTNSCPKSP